MSEDSNELVESAKSGADGLLFNAALGSYGLASTETIGSLVEFNFAPKQCTPDNPSGSDYTQRAVMSAYGGIKYPEPTTMLDSERAYQEVFAIPFAVAGTFFIAEVVGATTVMPGLTVKQIAKTLTYLELSRELFRSTTENRPQ
ncbi:MAG: hypothetical protein JSS56_16790 [Proteobacteria bacterium]|nr:hypothetical protein [Pseudomonadota bacterium]